MAFETIIGNKSSQYDIDNSATTYILASGTTINSTQDGIVESDAWHQNVIEINGTINATLPNKMGLHINGLETSVKIGTTGVVNGYHGVRSFGNQFELINNGTINGAGGIAVGIAFSEGNRFVNNGVVNGEIVVDRSGDTKIVLQKDSVVSNTSGSTMDIATYAEQKTHIVNKGEVTSSNWAFYGRDGAETLINRGSFDGAMALGEGNDVFDNRGGHISREIYGDDGNDTFILDKKIEIVEYADHGTDTVKSTVTMNLSTGLLGGQEIENLRLLGKKNINGMGNEFDNEIFGNSADNRLMGFAGDDLLKGGKGADVFVFRTGYEDDTVADFKNGTDHFDFKNWEDIKNFNDLKQNHLKVQGEDLLISAGDDSLRIIDTQKSELDASDFLF